MPSMLKLAQSSITAQTLRDTVDATVPEIRENVTGHSCAVAPVGTGGKLFVAPPAYPVLSAKGEVFLQVYASKCFGQRSGGVKKVVLAWSGKESPGISQDEKGKGVSLPSWSSPVWVSCSCSYFLFHCEWALARKGASDILYSNGQPAVQTNPKGLTIVCKHIYLALDDAIGRKYDIKPPPPAEVAVTAPVAEPEPAPETVIPIASDPDDNVIDDTPDDLLTKDDVPPGPATIVEGSYRGLSPDRYARLSLRLRSLVFPVPGECCGG